MGDAGVEVIPEALHHGRELAFVRGDEVVAEHGRERGRRGLVAAPRAQRDLGPLPLGRFAPQISHPMCQAPLPQRPGETALGGANEAGRAVGNDEQRIGQAAPLEILEERRAARRVLLGARRKVEEDLAPSSVISHAQSTVSRGKPACKRSATPSTKKYAIENSLRSRAAKASYSCHSRSVTWLTAARLSMVAPVASRKAASMSRTLRPRAYISTASCSSSAVRPAKPVRTRDTNGSARSATCGTRTRSRLPRRVADNVKDKPRTVLVVSTYVPMAGVGENDAASGTSKDCLFADDCWPELCH